MKVSVDPDDPDRHIKRLFQVIRVKARIYQMALKRRNTIKIVSSSEKLEELLNTAKEQRQQRSLQIGPNHRYVFDMAGGFFDLDEDEVAKFAIDSRENVDLVSSLFEKNGIKSILIQYQLSHAPAKESGRYDENLKHVKVKTVLFSDGKKGAKIDGISVIAYRLSNSTNIDPRNVFEEIFFTQLPEGESVIDSIRQNLLTSYRPALETANFDNCLDARKNDFLYSVDHFTDFLRSTQHDLKTCSVKFDIDHELFKGYLLVPHQIEETSKNRERVKRVENAFVAWLKQIKIVISQGNQLAHFGPESGPLAELEHWRHVLTKFKNVLEFTNSRAFQNHLRCLKLSRSKLLNTWAETENELITLTNEAEDNVRYLTSIEKFWDPLYREEPSGIVEAIPNLLQAVRGVYNKSRFYNTDLRMTGFLTKIVNQLIVASNDYLTNHHKISIWAANIDELVKKIEECKTLEREFREKFSKLLQDMADAGEKTFFCSSTYLFERYKSFERRLMKIQEVMIVAMRYKSLDRVKISGMEGFSQRIKDAYDVISKKPYDPLAHRISTFDGDYVIFQQEIICIETDMGSYVKSYFNQISNLEMRLLTLKRFEALGLECLNLDRRYLDIGALLEKEIEDIKDKYNEERANPPKEWNVPPAVARIYWARSMMKKIKDPVDVLSQHPCVISHANAQLSVKYYNYLGSIFIHYEAMHHKAWYTYADQVRSKLEAPLIRINTETNQYELNLHENVFQVVKETESILKLGLKVPETAITLTYCKDVVFDAYNSVRKLVDRNNSLRKSIYPIFLPLMRTNLIKLERIFAPALSTLTWLSLNLQTYFDSVNETLKPIEDFVKEISDINDAQIEKCFDFIENCNLIFLPEGASDPEELKKLNDEHRKDVEKHIGEKSITAERVAVDLINKFVARSVIPDYDESGKFQLPPDKINDTNWRTEEYKPINKYDWLSFEKLYKAVSYATPEENLELCFINYDGLNYDVSLLHIDCVELFAYYNHKMIQSLVKATRRSMETLKIRADIMVMIAGTSCEDLRQKSIFETSIELQKPNFVLIPNIQQLQQYFDKLLLNIVETFYAVSTWGQHAKTKERSKRKPLLDEVRQEKNFFKLISEHNEVVRYRLGFTDAITQFEKKVNLILQELKKKFEYLWDEKREQIIQNFVKSKPLLADIRDKFQLFEDSTATVKKIRRVICVQTLQIHCDKMIESVIEESVAWKKFLGSELTEKYRIKLNKIVEFKQMMKKKLLRKLADYDDCSKVFKSLEEIRENFYSHDRDLNILEEIYKIFTDFEIDVPAEDYDKIYGLRYNYKIFIEFADKVHQEAIERQTALLKELVENIEEFQDDIDEFEAEFNEIGPTIPGIPIKESSNRVMLFDIRLQELLRRYELYSLNEKIAGLPVMEYPMLKEREIQMDAMNTLYKVYWDYRKFIERYLEKQFKILDMNSISDEFHSLVEKSKEIENLPGDTKELPAYDKVREDMEFFAQKLPLLELMSDPAIQEEQWIEMEQVTGYKFDSHSENFTLSAILEAPLLQFTSELENICRIAIKQREDEAKDDFLFAPRK